MQRVKIGVMETGAFGGYIRVPDRSWSWAVREVRQCAHAVDPHLMGETSLPV